MTRVLFIDDNDDFRKLALRWFRSHGIVFMPEKEGIETIHELRREFPEVKIIAVTGLEPLRHYDVFEVARQVGAMKTLKKPFKFEDLIAAVRELTGG
ncbi:MAG: response regulator [Betaproteobacteria bacterium]|nr:MAG: response regulator [Betaproteobacteria bacterium]